MVDVSFKIGPFKSRWSYEKTGNYIEFVSNNEIPPLLLTYFCKIEPTHKTIEFPPLYETTAENLLPSYMKFYHAFNEHPYFGVYAHIVAELIKTFQADEFGFTWREVPVRLNLEPLKAKAPEKVKAFNQARAKFYEVIRAFMSREIDTEHAITQFNESIKAFTSFQFTGNLDQDLEQAGGPQGLYHKVLGEIHGNDEMAFRMYSKFKAITKKKQFLFK